MLPVGKQLGIIKGINLRGSTMHVISKRRFNDAARKYPNEAAALENMFNTLERTVFKDPHELKKMYATADNFKYKDKWWVLDLGGNNLRVIMFIQFVGKRMYIKHIVNHSEYDKLTEKYRKLNDI
jgi:mRNA interferase HigB